LWWYSPQLYRGLAFLASRHENFIARRQHAAARSSWRRKSLDDEDDYRDKLDVNLVTIPTMAALQIIDRSMKITIEPPRRKGIMR